MRALASGLAAVLCVGCGSAGPVAQRDPATPVAVPGRFDAAAVMRVRTELPPDYEVTELSGPAAPINLWGFGADRSASPVECGALAEPGGETMAGWSASGPGGIVYAVVVRALPRQDPPPGEPCASWSVSGGRTEGTVSYLPAPTIGSTSTLGLATDLTTRVEGGTETHSHAETFTARFDDHVTYVVVVTDPGSAGPALPPGFPSDLLVATVAAIRG